MSQCHDYINVHVAKSQVLVTIPGDTSDESLEEGEDCHNSTDDEDDAYCDSREEDDSDDDNNNGEEYYRLKHFDFKY